MIVVGGEALVDLVPAAGIVGLVAKPGGSPANVAVGLGRQDIPVSLLARLSTDHFGQMIRAHLAGSKVDLTTSVTASQRSTVAMVSLGQHGDAEYTFAIEGSADGGWRTDELPALPVGTVAVHLSGSLALAVPAMGDALTALLRREHSHIHDDTGHDDGTGVVVTIDPNPRPALTHDLPAWRDRLDEWLTYADIVKVSAEDLDWTFPDRSAPEVARLWHERTGGPSLVVVTRGADGVYAIGPHGETQMSGLRVPVVDTVGAGDAFTSGLLASLYRQGRLSRSGVATLTREQLDDSLRFAQRVAAVTCTRPGADPPWLAELTEVEPEADAEGEEGPRPAPGPN